MPSKATTVNLEDIDLACAKSGIGSRPPGRGTSIMGNAILLGGKRFEHGLGVHGGFPMVVDLLGKARRFTATVGADDEQLGCGSARPVEFVAEVDGQCVWSSGAMRAGDTPRQVDTDLAGALILHLTLKSLGPDTKGTIADWADALPEVEPGFVPFTFSAKGSQQNAAEDEINEAPRAQPAIRLTPSVGPIPRITSPAVITSPSVFGVRPGSPLIYRACAAGARPMRFEAEGLPSGTGLDQHTGMLTGRFTAEGEHSVTLVARNEAGIDRATLRLRVGNEICLTPPMGWTSWNIWGPEIDDRKIRDTARLLVETGLTDYGWVQVSIDDAWQGDRDPATRALTGCSTFPDMQELCDYIHSLGLRVGIYSTPWATTYMGYPGGSADTREGRVLEKRRDFGVYPFHEEDVAQFVRWGVDYLKYDWGPDIAHTTAMAETLRRCGRDIPLSLWCLFSAPLLLGCDLSQLDDFTMGLLTNP